LQPTVDGRQGWLRWTPGFTGADLANLVNEAGAAGDEAEAADATSMADFRQRCPNGSSRVWKRKTGCSTPGSGRSSPITRWAMPSWRLRCQVSTRFTRCRSSRAASARSAIRFSDRQRTDFLMTREELENKMAVSLGGRAAELIVFGHLSTGAADDLRRVTDNRSQHGYTLRNVRQTRQTSPMIVIRTQLLTGFRSSISPPHERDYAEKKRQATVDEEVRAIVEKAFQRRPSISSRNGRAVLDRNGPTSP